VGRKSQNTYFKESLFEEILHHSIRFPSETPIKENEYKKRDAKVKRKRKKRISREKKVCTDTHPRLPNPIINKTHNTLNLSHKSGDEKTPWPFFPSPTVQPGLSQADAKQKKQKPVTQGKRKGKPQDSSQSLICQTRQNPHHTRLHCIRYQT